MDKERYEARREPEGRLMRRETVREIAPVNESAAERLAAARQEGEAAKREYYYTPRQDASDLIDHSRGRLVKRLAMRETVRERQPRSAGAEEGGQR